MSRAGVLQTPPIRSLTSRALLDELPCQVDGRPVLGVGSASLSALPYDARGSFVVTGPSGSGRTVSLASLARSLHRWNPAMALFLITARCSRELAALPEWTEVASGLDSILALTSLLTGRMNEDVDQPPVAIVVESVDDLAGTAAEGPLSALVKAALSRDCFVVAEGETTFFGSSFGLPGLLKTSRSGLSLQPDGVEGPSIFRSAFPAFNRADQPEGRGPEMLQVALADAALPAQTLPPPQTSSPAQARPIAQPLPSAQTSPG
jgi:S-DNA-T family DNA segregation ATPase FtsK/SpoIIIE